MSEAKERSEGKAMRRNLPPGRACQKVYKLGKTCWKPVGGDILEGWVAGGESGEELSGRVLATWVGSLDTSETWEVVRALFKPLQGSTSIKGFTQQLANADPMLSFLGLSCHVQLLCASHPCLQGPGPV